MFTFHTILCCEHPNSVTQCLCCRKIIFKVSEKTGVSFFTCTASFNGALFYFCKVTLLSFFCFESNCLWPYHLRIHPGIIDLESVVEGLAYTSLNNIYT